MPTKKLLNFRLKGTHFVEVYERLMPRRETLLNSTSWRGLQPRTCGVTGIRQVGSPGEVVVTVEYRPPGCITYVGSTRYDGWTPMLRNQTRDGCLLSEDGTPLPDDGRPPVHVRPEVYPEVDFNEIDFGEYVNEVDDDTVTAITSSDWMSRLASVQRQVSFGPSNVMFPRRCRREGRVLVVEGTGVRRNRYAHLEVITVGVDTPYVEVALQDAVTELVLDVLGGKLSLRQDTVDGQMFLDLCTIMQDHTCLDAEGAPDYTVYARYVPGSYPFELAARLVEEFPVKVQVVVGQRPGLVIAAI